jgi:serine/threonine protein kinase
MIGQTLGPYRILDKLGAGGMGEVYRARDTRLDRVVAIKIVPESLAGDPLLRERFEREARAISQLDHPNICALYDVGSDGGVSYLVMQFLEGRTLADRLASSGALPVAEALSLAVQIAAALDAAHRRGITHRDLKPANVMVTKSGARLLDFGLAKTAAPAAAGGATMLATTPPAITTEGQILGTFQYMAPEQLEGRETDGRTDIFAFGALLYETVTGRKAFEARSQASLIAAIMSAVPPAVSTVVPSAPPALDRIVRKCLAKDPDERWQSARDLHDELVWLRDEASGIRDTPSTASSQAAIAAAPRRAGRERLAFGLAAAGVLTALALLVLGRAGYLQPSDTPLVSMSSISLPPDVTLGLTDASEMISVSPDGRFIVFTAGHEGRRQLWLRRLDRLDTHPLAGTDDGGAPFWSPDSRSIGFKSGGRLKRVDVSGGPVLTLANSTLQSGSAWGPDNTIVFAPKAGPLYRMPASGGDPMPVTTLEGDEVAHLHPTFLPDGRRFLYVARSLNLAGGLYVASLDGHEPRRRLADVSSNVQYASGHLLYLRQRTLMAQPFDPVTSELTGEPVPIAEQLETGGGPTGGGGAFSVSSNGVLTYRAGSQDLRSQLRWVDRSGKALSQVGDSVDQMGVQTSPDGARVAVSVLDVASNTRDLWTHDLARGIRTRFTFDAADEMQTAWSRGGHELIFNSRRNGRLDLFRRPASGTAPEMPLFSDGANNLYPTSVSPDGRLLLYFIGNAASPTGNDIMALPLEGDAKASVVVQTPYNDAQGQFSPDGRWVAYQSNESGRVEVYVVSFPDTSAKWQVSNGGGDWPRWSADGREIFYLSDNRLMAVPFGSGARGVELGSPQTLFTADLRRSAFGGSNGYPYDVAPDGRRFLLNALAGSRASATFTLVVNWHAGLAGR